MSNQNPLVVSKVGKNGKAYSCLFLTDGPRDQYPVFIGAREAVNMLGPITTLGISTVMVHAAKFAKDGKLAFRHPLLGMETWEEKHIDLLRMASTPDEFGFRKGQKAYGKLVTTVQAHGEAAFVSALKEIAGDLKVGEAVPPRRKGKVSRPADEPTNPPAPIPAPPKAEPAVIKADPAPTPARKPEPAPVKVESAPARDALSRLAALEQALTGMMLVMQNMQAEIATLRAEIAIEPEPTPPAPSGPSGNGQPDKPTTAPRKGGKGFKVVHTTTVKGREYGLCDDGVTRMHVQGPKRDYWRLQTGANPIFVSAPTTSTTPRKARKSGRKVGHKAMFNRPMKGYRKPMVAHMDAGSVRMLGGR